MKGSLVQGHFVVRPFLKRRELEHSPVPFLAWAQDGHFSSALQFPFIRESCLETKSWALNVNTVRILLYLEFYRILS